jgi:hypothetical protein
MQKADEKLNAELAAINLKLEKPLADLAGRANKKASKKHLYKIDAKVATEIGKKLSEGVNPEMVAAINEKLNASWLNLRFTPVRIGNATKIANLPSLFNSISTGVAQTCREIDFWCAV